MENGKGRNRENVKRKRKNKGIEKVEKRDRCTSCIGGLMCLFYEWIFVESNGVRVKVKRGGTEKVNVGKVRLTCFYRLYLP